MRDTDICGDASEHRRARNGPGRPLHHKRARRALAALACSVAGLGLVATQAVAEPLAPSTATAGTYATGLNVSIDAAPSARAIEGVHAAAAALPASVDLSADAMPVGNQGAVNSCAAWATVYGALGYWVNEEHLNGGALAPMYTYAQLVDGQNEGTYIDDNLNIALSPERAADVSHQGVDDQSDYTQGTTDYTDLPTAGERRNAVNWELSGYQDLYVPMSDGDVSQQSIEEALAAGDPVVIGMYDYESFDELGSADNGYYAGPTGDDTLVSTHAVVALGYNANGLVIENSWGTGWGDNGWATLSWSFVESSVLEATAVGPLIPQTAPVSTVAPVVTGSPNTSNVGSVLSVSAGTWNPTPNLFPATTPAITYQWQEWERSVTQGYAWTAIPGATSSTFTLTSAYLGQALRALVTASDQFGAGSEGTSIIGPVTSLPPVDQSVPTISGTTQEGETLTAANGSWNPGGDTYTYQWLRKAGGSSTWAAISGATKATYIAAAADLNGQLEVQVTAHVGSTQATATSSAVGPISNGPPMVIVMPSISGTPRQGLTLTANSGTWLPTGTITYQWLRQNNSGVFAPISGATAATYLLSAADVGTSVEVQVSVANTLATSSVDSQAVGAVASGVPANTAVPTVKGTAARGSVLTAAAGSWVPAATTVSYQWQHGTPSGWTNISGATASTYTAAKGDEGLDLRVLVTASNSFGAGTPAPSAPTSAVASVAPAIVSGKAPTISSSKPAVGVKLTAGIGTWTGVGNTYAYQWSHSTGSGPVAISGATAATYTPSAADKGYALVVTVTATNPDGTAHASSSVTSAIPGTAASAPKLGAAKPKAKSRSKAKDGRNKR